MKNNYISYYELLTMIKERDIPPKIILHLVPDKSVEYISDYDYINSDFIGYEILNDEYEDENYSYHLGDCFLESTMFDKCIEIAECNNDFEDIEEIENLFTPISQELNSELGGVVSIYNMSIYELKNTINQLIKNQKKIIERLKDDNESK